MAKKTSKSKDDPLQPVLNIGMVGHVDHGKTTLLERLSGKWTDTHSEELKRGITIRLGYADVVIRKKSDGTFTTHDEPDTVIERKVSFVDAPGHESLMATMLSGAALMDGALLLVAANEKCPQPQTQEHIMALEIIGLKHVIVVQNKIDLVSEEQALKNYEQIKAFLKGTPFENAPIVPISAHHKAGLGSLLKVVQETIPTPQRDASIKPIMLIARSFDINKPGALADEIVGGVLGGGLRQGTLKIGDEIEIKPGYMVVEKNQQIFKSLKTIVVGLNTGGQQVEEVGPAGSVGVLTALDPSIVKSDKLAGAIAGHPGTLPPVWYDITLKITLLDRVVGMDEKTTVDPIKLGEPLMLNVNAAATVGMVTELKKGFTKCKLKLPVCCDVKARLTVSRRIGQRFRLIGFAEIQDK